MIVKDMKDTILFDAGEPNKPETEWLGPVNDEQYAEANKMK
ncbi:hypothetical protein [Paenibacillus wynnii]|nr:hypothetical protein [Paenibacillus wynnii]